MRFAFSALLLAACTGKAEKPPLRTELPDRPSERPVSADDQPSADLATTRMQAHEKTAWMLRSLLA